MRILMVCLGNICRSPIAEGVLQRMANDEGLDWQVESAGTESYHIGSAPHKYSQAICEENGLDISAQRARQFNANDFDKYDKIYALALDVLEEIEHVAGNGDDMNNVLLFLNELEEGNNESVPDPYYGGKDGYTHVYELIEKTCQAIINKYK